MENIMDIDMINEIFEDDGTMNAVTSAAAFMVQENKGFLSWMFGKIEKHIDDIPKHARYLELITIISQRQDVHVVLPDWSKLPSTKEFEGGDGKKIQGQGPSKKQKTDTDAETDVNAVELLLQLIGRFRKVQPQDEAEIDCLENACTALSCCLAFSAAPDNLKAFLDGQGVELIVRCLKERTHAAGCGLKLLDFFGNEPIHQQACEHLVTAGGFKYLFPLFMGTRVPKQADADAASVDTTATKSNKGKAQQKLKKSWLQNMQAQVVRIFYALTRQLTDSSPDDGKLRFIAKFLDDKDKCDRLVELLLLYDKKARKAEYDFYRSDVEDNVEEKSMLELAAIDAKLKGGGEIFHRLGAIGAYLCVSSKRCHEQLISQLRLQQSGISAIKAALEEFASVIGSGAQQQQLEYYLEQL